MSAHSTCLPPSTQINIGLGNKCLYKVPFDYFILFPVFALELEATRSQHNSAVAFVCLGPAYNVC